ncbi:MAG TPA: 2OG-Fe(II) oxygenase [Terriglobales bacterium]|nr:2OG-Fe(II) oxygenase [Terriglobales bacterium]
MQYLDYERMAGIDAESFRNTVPFPWISIQRILTDAAFARLCATLPRVEQFERQSGREGGYGDLYALQYRPNLDLAEPWREFTGQLCGEQYQHFLRSLIGLPARERIELTMHWHFGPRGFSLSPHVDARRKIASHIFYFNTEADWDPHWGGQTAVLADTAGFLRKKHPQFGDLREIAAPEILGNRSLLFQRTEQSWHGVRPLAYPEGKLRKVFIVVVNRVTLQVRWRHLRGKDADGYELRVPLVA